MTALAVFKPCPQNKIHTYIKTLGWDRTHKNDRGI